MINFENITKLASGAFFAQLITVLITPYLTRSYEPEDFAMLSIMMILSSLAAILTPLRIDLALPSISDKTELRKETNSLILLTFFNALLFSGICLLFLYFTKVENSGLFAVNFCYFLSIIFSGLLIVLNSRLLAEKRFGEQSLVRLSQVLVSLSSQIVLWRFTRYGLIYGFMIGQVFSFLILMKIIPDVSFMNSGFQDFRRMLGRYRKYIRFDVFTGLLSSISQNFILMAAAMVGSVQSIGYLSLTQRVGLAPASIVGTAISSITLATAADELEKGSIQEMYVRIVTLGVWFIVPPVTIVALNSESLFQFIFGEEWSSAGRYFSYLSPWICGQFIAAPISNMIYALDIQRFYLNYSIVSLLIRIAVFTAGSILGGIDVALIAVGVFSFFLYFYVVIYVGALVKMNTNIFLEKFGMNLMYLVFLLSGYWFLIKEAESFPVTILLSSLFMLVALFFCFLQLRHK